jgi:hypothetical protein
MTQLARTVANAAALAALAVIVALLAIVLGAPTASAANPPIAISDDGVAYGDSFPGNLYDGVLLIPGASASRAFWVMNTGPSSANLAITLIGVESASPDFLAAITNTASAGSHMGSALFSSAGDCVSLIHGVHLAPGESAKVSTTLAMSNVSGTTGQGAQAAFNLGVNLTSDDVPAPTGCTASPNPTPNPSPAPTPGPTSGGPDSGGGGTVVIPGLPTQPTDPGATPTATPTPSVSPSPSASPEPGEPSEPGSGDVPWNTKRLYQEWFVAAWVIEFMLGGYFAWRHARGREGEGIRS